MSWTCPQNVSVLTILGHLQKCPESICPMSFFLFIKLVPCPCPKLPKNMSPAGHVPDASRTCPQNVPVLTICGHLQIGRVQLSLENASFLECAGWVVLHLLPNSSLQTCTFHETICTSKKLISVRWCLGISRTVLKYSRSCSALCPYSNTPSTIIFEGEQSYRNPLLICTIPSVDSSSLPQMLELYLAPP